ncbi:hypothetical protein UCRPA7_4373 [Phaeoacremonium minimum UCRPA7]|uniref:Uncharacterized protein n=1 Tax=Phaeoacremonium minimum (strain UCR-PA7) TaxID=1286976 RepID=R8BLA7_PHAM7|nr:hypothetical protein UCRPA7_4373 [Phaeoacremonium minimum UCRPA7]EOO00139.1 hypothetical protein UCRPA7_4373 [Phaeoacremonium minimum UCRPA7]
MASSAPPRAAPPAAPAPAPAPGLPIAPVAYLRRSVVWGRIQKVDPKACKSQGLKDALVEKAASAACRQLLRDKKSPAEVDEEFFRFFVDRFLWAFGVKPAEAFPWLGMEVPSSGLVCAKYREYYKWNAPLEIPSLATRQKLWAELCPNKPLLSGLREFEVRVEASILDLGDDKVVRSIQDMLPEGVAVAIEPLAKDKPGNGNKLIVGLRHDAELVGRIGRRNKLNLLRLWNQLIGWKSFVSRDIPSMNLERYLDREIEMELSLLKEPAFDEEGDERMQELTTKVSALELKSQYEARVVDSIGPIVKPDEEEKPMQHKLQEVLQWVNDNLGRHAAAYAGSVSPWSRIGRTDGNEKTGG